MGRTFTQPPRHSVPPKGREREYHEAQLRAAAPRAEALPEPQYVRVRLKTVHNAFNVLFRPGAVYQVTPEIAEALADELGEKCERLT